MALYFCHSRLATWLRSVRIVPAANMATVLTTLDLLPAAAIELSDAAVAEASQMWQGTQALWGAG